MIAPLIPSLPVLDTEGSLAQANQSSRLTAFPPYRLTALPPYRLTALPPYRLTALPLQPTRQLPLSRRRGDVLLLHRSHADHPEELLGIVRHPLALFLGHFLVGVELVERVVHGLHAVLLTRLQRGIDLVDLVIADERPDGGGRDHDLARHDPASAPQLGQQSLGHYALEHEGQLGP